MVGDRKWEKWMASFCRPFTTAKVRYFEMSQADAAWKWLEENDESQKTAEADRPLVFPDDSDVWPHVW